MDWDPESFTSPESRRKEHTTKIGREIQGHPNQTHCTVYNFPCNLRAPSNDHYEYAQRIEVFQPDRKGAEDLRNELQEASRNFTIAKPCKALVVVTTCATHGCFGLCLVFLGKALWVENSVILRHKAQHYHLKCPTWRAGKYLGAMELIRGCGGSDCAQIHDDTRRHANYKKMPCRYLHAQLANMCAVCVFFPPQGVHMIEWYVRIQKNHIHRNFVHGWKAVRFCFDVW